MKEILLADTFQFAYKSDRSVKKHKEEIILFRSDTILYDRSYVRKYLELNLDSLESQIFWKKKEVTVTEGSLSLVDYDIRIIIIISLCCHGCYSNTSRVDLSHQRK